MKTRKRLRRFPQIAGLQNRRGAVMVLVAFMLMAFFGILGLITDLGFFFHQRRVMQTAADAAAYTGALELHADNEAGLEDIAKEDAARNGFSQENGATVEINHPPLYGPRAGDDNFVEAIVRRDEPTFFMRVFGHDLKNVAARAVAGLIPGATGCVWVLNPDRDKTLTINSDSELNLECGVMVNSDAENALFLNSDATLTAPSVSVVGDTVVNSNSVIDSPEITIGAEPFTDPLAHIQPPVVGPCNHTSEFKVTSGTRTMTPGVYCGGIVISGGADVTFSPGVYIIRGFGMKVVDAGTTIVGDGVSFYNTFNPSDPGGFKPIEISSGAWADLDPPAAGQPMENVLFFGDRNVPMCLSDPFACYNKIDSQVANAHFGGIIYFPTQHLLFGSTSSAGGWTALVTATLDINSHSTIELGIPPIGVFPGAEVASLVE